MIGNGTEQLMVGNRRKQLIARAKKDKAYYVMFLPVVVFLIVFKYAPMVGLTNSLYEFTPFKRVFIGLDNFVELFAGVRSISFWRAFRNTLVLSVTDLTIATFVSVTVALLLNEIAIKGLKNFTQTILYLPHFMSWIVAASVFTLILSPTTGVVNNIRMAIGLEPIYYLAERSWWRPVYYFVTRWKETGWGTIIYLAAMSGIPQEQYEASAIDGASRWQQTWHVTLPAITTTILTVFILYLGRIMTIFHSVFALYNANVYDVADVLQTFALRIGVQNGQYGIGTAISFFSSVVGLTFVLVTNKINTKIRGSSLL